MFWNIKLMFISNVELQANKCQFDLNPREKQIMKNIFERGSRYIKTVDDI